MDIAYFAHELGDPAVRKRVRMLTAGGAQVTLLGFERRRHETLTRDGPEPHVLGRTHGGRFVARAAAVALAAPRAWGLRKQWARADAIVARNLEMLVIVVALTLWRRPRARIVYECLDIHRLMLGGGPASAVLRVLERFCLRRVAFVLTSSPAFVSAYFRAMQGFEGETLVAENKILALADAGPAAGPRTDPPPGSPSGSPSGPPAGPPVGPSSGPPWIIAWCGVLRCRTSFELLRDLPEDVRAAVRVELWGAPDLDQIPGFHDGVAAAEHLTFKGPYKPSDLGAIYARAHFAWAIDFYEAGGNSDWLLPNRLYEGLSFGAVPIAVEGVETARWLAAHQVGVVAPRPLADGFAEIMRSCTPVRYETLRQAVAALDPAATRADAGDCEALTDRIVGGEGGCRS